MSYEAEMYDGLEDIVSSIMLEEQYLLANHLWEDRNGCLHVIEEMDTNYIKNCIHKIYRRNGTWRPEYLRLFENELRSRKYV